MFSELKPAEHISEYVGAGPKNYGYKTVNSMTGECKTVCKVRGITLNKSASQLVNFDRIKDIILRRDAKETVTVHTEKKIKCKRLRVEMVGLILSRNPRIRYKMSIFLSGGD
jgi:hypothetical protein